VITVSRKLLSPLKRKSQNLQKQNKVHPLQRASAKKAGAFSMPHGSKNAWEPRQKYKHFNSLFRLTFKKLKLNSN
jgi:hypothetical protein